MKLPFLLGNGQIEEVALVTDKGSQRRRGFVFITFMHEDTVDKCTDKTFHTLEGHQVTTCLYSPVANNPTVLSYPSVSQRVTRLRGGVH